MDSVPAVTCFRGWHLACSVSWIIAIFAYFLVCNLLELVNGLMSNISRVRMGDRYPFEHVDPSKVSSFWMARRVLTVSFKGIYLGMELPQECTGAFTTTSYKAVPRMRLLMKVLHPAMQVLLTLKVCQRFTVYWIMSLTNFIIHFVYPPYIDRQLGFNVLLVQLVVLFGASCTFFLAIVDPHLDSLDEDNLVLISFCVCVFVCASVVWLYNCCKRRIRTARTSIRQSYQSIRRLSSRLSTR